MTKEIYKPEQVSKDLITKAIGSDKEAKEEELYRPKPNIEYIRSIANIPKRYRDADFTPINTKQESLISVIRSNLNNTIEDIPDLVIYGTVGTGKTHIAIGALNKLIEKGVYCKYTTESQLLEFYFRKQYDTFENFKKTDLLVIDEVGKRELAEWQQVQVEELISYRYNEMLPTIFITNLSATDFKKALGDRITDRLRDNKVVQFTIKGESLRGRN